MLLIEPYYGGSHAAWVDGIRNHSTHEVICINHPDAYWRWRLRGGAVTLAEETKKVIDKTGEFDLVLVSGIIDLSTWLGLTRKYLNDVPVVLYLHENQLNYPTKAGEERSDEFSLINWKSLLAADEIWFNSEFQRQAMFEALPSLLRKAPDLSHEHLIPKVKERTRVVPVGVDLKKFKRIKNNRSNPLVLWNQRWDYDKNPKEIASSILELSRGGIEFDVALVGENVRKNPKELLEVKNELGAKVVQFGFLPRDEYVKLLNQTDIVVSAAVHEFFGIAIVEAVAAGAFPILPNHQNYPELIPEKWHKSVLYPPGQLVERLREVLLNSNTWRPLVEGLDEEMRKYEWAIIIKYYDSLIETVISEYGHKL